MYAHTACFGVSTACLLLGIVLCVPLVSALEHSYVLLAWGLLLVWCVAGVGLPGCCALARGSSCCARLCALLPFLIVAPTAAVALFGVAPATACMVCCGGAARDDADDDRLYAADDGQSKAAHVRGCDRLYGEAAVAKACAGWRSAADDADDARSAGLACGDATLAMPAALAGVGAGLVVFAAGALAASLCVGAGKLTKKASEGSFAAFARRTRENPMYADGVVPPSVAEAELSRLHERLEHGGGGDQPAATEQPPAKDGSGSRFAATTLYSAREGGARTERETRTMQRFHRDHTPFATSWGDSQQTVNKSWEC